MAGGKVRQRRHRAVLWWCGYAGGAASADILMSQSGCPSSAAIAATRTWSQAVGGGHVLAHATGGFAGLGAEGGRAAVRLVPVTRRGLPGGAAVGAGAGPGAAGGAPPVPFLRGDRAQLGPLVCEPRTAGHPRCPAAPQ